LLALGDDQGQALEREQRAESRDERGDAEVRRDEAVDGADRCSRSRA
jgi:hypothetical protein